MNESCAKRTVDNISGSLALSGINTAPKQRALMLDIVIGNTDVKDTVQSIIDRVKETRNQVSKLNT